MQRNRAVVTLALAGNALTLVVIVGGQTSLRGTTSTTRSIVGSWLVVPMAPNRPPGLPNAFAFTSDGAIVRFSPTDSGATGVWTGTGRRTVTYTFVALDRNARGEFSGTIKVRGKVTLNEAYDEFGGGGKVDFFDAQGNLVQSGEFTTHATRIKLESP
jgi:hypothetical protein